jgi:hypothetical protein
MLAESPWTMQYKMNYTRDHVYGGHKPSGRPYKAAAKVPEGQLDPNDLTRRLYVVLAEQKAHAERRRRARGEPSNSKDSVGTAPSARGRETRQKAAKPPADLITELRRTESTKHTPSHTAAAGPAPDSQSEAYHHVPQEAARQFTRTTTVENMRDSNLVHKLSKHALKFHLEGPKALRPSNNDANNGPSKPALAPAELTRALQQTQSQRDKLLDRNQFQRTRILEEAAAQPHHHHHQPTQRRTLEDELSRILPGGGSHHYPNPNQTAAAKHLRRNSTGNTITATSSDPASTGATSHHARHSLIAAPDTLVMDTLLEDDPTMAGAGDDGDALVLGRFAAAERARVDWTQSDETGRMGSASVSARVGGGHGHSRGVGGSGSGSGVGPKMLLLSPLLRKADSLWTLRGRRGSKDSSGGVGGGVGGEEVVQSPTTPTAAKGGKGF